MALEEVLCLVLALVLESELTDLRLTLRTFLPAYLRTLVTSDMNIFCREKLAYLCKYVLQELINLRISCTEDIV